MYLGDLASPQTLNPYSYVGNNPLSAVDPSGYSADRESMEFSRQIGRIMDNAMLSLDVALRNYQHAFSGWLAGCRAALPYCDGADMPIPTGVRDAAVGLMRTSTAVLRMINDDMTSREQLRELTLGQAVAGFRAFRNVDLVGYAEVNGRMVPVVARDSAMDFSGTGRVFRSPYLLADAGSSVWQGGRWSPDIPAALQAEKAWAEAAERLNNARFAGDDFAVLRATEQIDDAIRRYDYALYGNLVEKPGPEPIPIGGSLPSPSSPSLNFDWIQPPRLSLP